MYKKYLKSLNLTNNVIIDLNEQKEINRISDSERRWAENKTKDFRNLDVKKGEIYQIEFGKNYIPEMSYEHRGLIIGKKGKLLYALPIFTYKPDKYNDVFHPIDSPNSKSDFFLLKNEEFDFIDHDSIIKVNDLRSVSLKRIIYQHRGRIEPDSNTYLQIEKLAIQKHFGSFMHNHLKMEKELEKAKKELVTLKLELKKQTHSH